MKRTIFLFIVLSLVVPNFAAAQTECKLAFGDKFFKPASVALELVATVCGYTLVYPSAEDVPNQIVNLDGKEFTTVGDAASGILANVPYKAEVNAADRTITVRRKTTTSPQTPAPAQTVVGTLPPQNVQYLNRRRPGLRTRLEMMAAGVPTETQYVPVYQPYPNYGGYTNIYGANYGFGIYQQHMIDISTWGALRFKKGREAFMENVEIYGCNQRLAQADEGNNIWDKKVFVPVNCRPLTFRYSDGKMDWEVEIDEMIVPLRLQDVKNITLDQGFFARARQRTKRLMYDMEEQPDGSFKKVPRQVSP